MAISIYDACVPIVVRNLTVLDGLLKKAEVSAEARKIDLQAFLQARLAPDMHPLLKQVQSVSDIAKTVVARLVGAEPPVFADDEKTFADLHARIAKTLDYVKGVNPAGFEGAETREIVLKFPGTTMTFTGKDFLQNFVLPNLYFHVTTAYAILRHNGVDLGKRDFLAS